MRIRRDLSYANVTATLALFIALGGGAYAINKVSSHEIANGTIKSIDLKDRKAVRAADVKRNSLTGKQIRERTLDAGSFASMVGDEAGDCDPASSRLIKCVTARLRLAERSRILVIATAGQDSVGGPSNAHCEVRVDNEPEPVSVNPGEEASDNTSGAATNGFARTVVSRDSVARGQHEVSLACRELSGNVRIAAPTIAAIAIGAR